MGWSCKVGFLSRTMLWLAIVGMGVEVAMLQAEESGKQPIRLSAENRERCLTILRAGLKSDEFWPSMHAAEALTLAGYGAEVRVALEPLLATDKDDQHRCGLAREMARAGDRRKIAILLEVLGSADTYGHTHAAESLFKIAEVGDGTLLRKTMRESKDAKRQLMAAAALARCGSPEALALIRQKLRDDNPEARKIAAWILIRLGDESDLPALRKNAARDNMPVDQAYVMYALACLGDAKGLAELERNYKHENVEIRTFAAEFTSTCRAVQLADKLTELLSDPVLDVRIRAAQSLLALSMPTKE
jgi:sialidase-1